MKKVSALKLSQFTYQVFRKKGLSVENAIQASEVLLKADLSGIDSHGVARLSNFVYLLNSGRVKANPKIKVINEFAATATLDGDKGLGLITAPYAMKMAIEKAAKYGIGWVCIGNSNHFGIASYHVSLALSQKMIGISMSNASPLVAPLWGKEKLLGTNPFSIGFPSKKQPHIIMDMATSAVSNGKLEIAQRKGEDLPIGWAQDKDGNPSKANDILKKKGALLPLGSTKPLGGHKGYCLGAMVDIFSGVLSGANFGPWVPPSVAFLPLQDNQVGQGVGHVVGAINLKGFLDFKTFQERLAIWKKTFKNSKPISPDQPVMLPGEPEYLLLKKRKNSFIPISIKIYQDLRNMAQELAIAFKL